MGYKIGAVVEGSSDEAVIRAIWENLSRKLNASLSLEVKVAKGGKIKNKRKLKSSVEYLKVRGCQRVMVLIDSHCNPSDIRNNFEGYIDSIGGELFVVKHAIESWLLADVSAISIVLRARIKEKIPKLEECHEPKEVLKGMFKKYANRDYVEVKDAGKIAERVDVNIMKKYSNFNDFMNSLFDCT